MVGMSSTQVGGATRVIEELCVVGEAAGRSSAEEEEAAGTRSVQEEEATGMTLVLEEEEEAGMSSARGQGGGGDKVAPNIHARIRTPLESIDSLRIDIDGTHGEKHEVCASAWGFYWR
jgi:hypothetical protein